MRKLIEKYSSLSIELKATFWYLICSLIQKGISVVFTPVFTRIMSTDQYGLFNYYISWKDIFFILITLRLSAGVFGPGLIKNKEDCSYSSSLHGLTTFLVLIWLGGFCIFNSQLQQITNLSSILLYIMVLHVWTQAVFEMWAKEQQIRLRYRALVIVTLSVALIRPILGVLVVIFSENEAVARVVEMASVDFIAYVGLFIYVIVQGKKLFSAKYWRYALAINLPLIPHFLSQTILHDADRIMIKKMIDERAAGIYSLAYQIAIISVFLNTALSQALSPWTFRRLKEEKSEKIERVGFGALLLIAVVNLFFIALAPELVFVFGPSRYREAIWIIPPVAMSVFFQFSYLLFSDIELYYEKSNLIAIATTAGAILNLLLNYIFIRQYGYYAAGYTTLICYCFIAVVHYCAMKKVCNDNLNHKTVYSFKTWLKISAGFLAIGFLLLFSYSLPILRYIIIVASLLLLVIERHKIIGLIKSFLLLKDKQQGEK